MNCATQDMGTLTKDETIEDRYKRCGLLNVIQHIDIYGKFRSNYVEPSKYRHDALAVTSISSSGRRFAVDALSDSGKALSDKLSKFSVTTRVSGMNPGHDILSKRVRRARLATDKKSNFKFAAVLSKVDF